MIKKKKKQKDILYMGDGPLISMNDSIYVFIQKGFVMATIIGQTSEMSANMIYCKACW